MCTVSIVPLHDGFRLLCNRDEQLTRPPALVPITMRVGRRDVTAPVDPPSGGTWLAVNDAGLVLVLLNRQAGTTGSACRSRGTIIPSLAGASQIARVARALRAFWPGHYAGFQLVAAAGRRVLVVTSNGRSIDLSTRDLDRPLMFTSSSLGDRSAERVRRPLFESLVCRGLEPLEGQQRFHDHRWPGCQAFSVRMRRADAQTVSRSAVHVAGGRVSFAYEPLTS